MRTLVPLAALTGAYLATAAAASSCSVFGPGCSMAPCPASLTIELAGMPTGAFRIEALAVGSEDRRVFDCPDPSRCVPIAWFRDFTPDEVIVRVTTQAGVVEQTVRPSYETVHPNGRQCEPTCRKAAVIRVPLPS